MKTWLRTASAAGLLVALAAIAGMAQQGQTPTFRAGVNFVSVDVIATDKAGSFLTTLKPEDFVVTEQGTPQHIDTFKLVTLDGGLLSSPGDPPREIRSDDDERREAARDDVRLFAIFLDDYHVTRESSLTARDQIARFVETALGPSDMVGIMYPLERLSSLLMTRDHDAVVKALSQFVGRKGDYTPVFAPEESYSYKDPTIVEGIRSGVSRSAIEGLIAHLGGLKDGRKALILVTESVGLSPLDLQEMYTEANRNNVAIYWVDPRMLGALSGSPTVRNGQSLRALALADDSLTALSLYTDGRAIVHTNELTAAMKQIVRDSSGYYLLGYNSTFTAADGKFHEISVRVKRPGVDVRARKGYWALRQQDVAAMVAPRAQGPPKAIEDAINAATAVTRSRVIRTWVGFDRGENGRSQVTLLWEPASAAPGEPPAQPMQVAVTASGADGNQYFRGRAERIMRAGVSTPGSGGVATFEAPPGIMEMRISVQGAGSDVLDSETRSLTIPDLTAAGVRLSTPQLFRARTARELQQIEADPRALPTAAREFIRADLLLVRVAAYGQPGSASTFTARLLSRTGQPMADLTVKPYGSSSDHAEMELPLGSQRPGDYVIEINATSDTERAQELIAFRIVA